PPPVAQTGPTPPERVPRAGARDGPERRERSGAHMHMHMMVNPVINLRFSYVSQHILQYANNLVNANPVLPAANRLYVIQNQQTNRWFYIGTAANVSNRFTARWTACRDMGFGQNEVNGIRVFTIDVFTNNVSTPPGDNGVTWGPPALDVEHLLIRTYMSGLNATVRNLNKTQNFPNYQGVALNVTLVDNAGIGFPTSNFNVPNGANW